MSEKNILDLSKLPEGEQYAIYYPISSVINRARVRVGLHEAHGDTAQEAFDAACEKAHIAAMFE